MTKRAPRRVKKLAGPPRVYDPYITYFQEHPTAWAAGRNGGIPPAYHCNVTRDLPYTAVESLGDAFRADCCNPHCDGEIVNRFAAPWCRDCNESVPMEWKKWFWSIQTKKAFDRLVRDVFE